jgi:hypothetical protein
MAKQQNKSKQTIEKEFFEHVRPSSPLKWFAMADEVAAIVAVGSCFPGFRNIARLAARVMHPGVHGCMLFSLLHEPKNAV